MQTYDMDSRVSVPSDNVESSGSLMDVAKCLARMLHLTLTSEQPRRTAVNVAPIDSITGTMNGQHCTHAVTARLIQLYAVGV